MNNKNVNAQLKDILRNAEWTQEQLARRLDVPQKTLNFWINEKNYPRERNIKAIDELYMEIVGREQFDPVLLVNMETEALNKQTTIKEIIANEDLLDKMAIYLTYHTNTIEGSTMTLADVKKVLEDDDRVLANRPAKEQVGARNHRAALFYLLDELNLQGKNFKWTEDLILQTHLRLMNTIIGNAGTYRNHGVRIMGSRVALSNYMSVPQKMKELIGVMNESTKNIMERLAWTHATFERVHPFSDGNGRTGRLILFVQALQYGLVPPLVTKERKRAYYKYLEIAQLRDEYELLRLLIAESILFTNKLMKL